MSENRIRLKRTSTEARVPTVSDLTLGELAVNTYDGKLFFKKDNGADSIESIVTTNELNTPRRIGGSKYPTIKLNEIIEKNAIATELAYIFKYSFAFLLIVFDASFT